MKTQRGFIFLILTFLAFALSASAAVVTAIFNNATDVPVTAAAYTATGNSVDLTLGYSPVTGTQLTVVKNTGLDFISGVFSNLTQGQTVTLSYGGVNYNYVVNYYGGSGNDLVLVWKSNRLLAWGWNGNGQLGNNSTTNGIVPMAVMAAGVLSSKTVLTVSSGRFHSVALCSDGTLVAWGQNDYGQLGNNSTTDSYVPVAVTATGVLVGKTVVSVSAGAYHSVALCSDGTVATWGFNGSGHLGNNSRTDSNIPVAVTATGVLAGKTVVAISAGGSHSVVLCSDGTLAAWGYNGFGQLGNNSETFSNVPVAVTATGVLAGKTLVAVSAGNSHSMALCSDGIVAAWGYNYYAQLGNISYNHYSSVPELVTTTGVLSGKSVVAVSAGYGHSMALCSDGTLAAWGYNFYGQLGNNSTIQSRVPVVTTGTGVLSGRLGAALSAGRYHSLALCSDGTLAAWGQNDYGQLGNNRTTDSTVPVAVSTSALVSGERFTTTITGADAFHTLALVAAPPETAKVTTPTSASVTASTASLGGNVTSEGDAMITERGIVFAATVTNSNPSIGGTGVTKVTATGNTGIFTAPVTGLSGKTAYSFKAYAINAMGTGYSSVGTFGSALENLTVNYTATDDAPETLPSVTIVSGSTATLSLGYAPVAGTELTVVKNTNLDFISGVFSNLTHGQTVTLSYGGVDYNFVVNYYGGTGNDLVLMWKNSRLLAWGYNFKGQLGNEVDPEIRASSEVMRL